MRPSEASRTFQDRWIHPRARLREGLAYCKTSRGTKRSSSEGDPSKPGSDSVGWEWLSRWHFLSLRKGLTWCLWEGGLSTALLVLWKPGPAGRSVELNSWIHLVWFLGVNECCLKQFLELQPLPVTCKMSKGDLKTRWSWEGDISTEGTTVGREIYEHGVFSWIGRAQKPILFRNLTFGALGHFQWHTSAKLPLFNMCELNPSADTDTWISLQQAESVLRSLRRRWSGMQRVWDSHQVWFIRAFSSHSLFQEWLVSGIAGLHLHPVTGL